MPDKGMGERQKSLEEEFFLKENAKLLAELRSSQEKEQARATMAAASGVSEPAVLDSLIDQGLTPATVAALALVPLVAVAWADGKLEDKEREAVLKQAAASGVASGSAGYALLEGWLGQRPSSALMQNWAEYAQALVQTLEAEPRKVFCETLLGRARSVAGAAGGFAGMGSKISDSEERTLRDIEVALSA